MFLPPQRRLYSQEMEVPVSVVVVPYRWSMTTSLHSPVGVVVRYQISNFSVNDVTEVNPIVVCVKSTKREWGVTVVRERLQNLNPQVPQHLLSV
jgi:hypothetical protein